jgi:lipopolysaccharide biosynthesis regulator YciM
MEFEFWWLLAFPLFFSLGWLAARVDIKHLVSESRSLPRAYFKGLNFLLNEKPDEAIEAFIEVVKVDRETVDLHFALGSLFRRRGETERAIRMHRNLVDRGDLPAEQKLQAMYELGQDFLKAGLLDRAEESFSKLRDTAYASSALRFLLDIYQQEKDWAKAIDTARELEKLSGDVLQKEIANFHCELAAGELTHSRPDAGLAHLEEALKANRKCVRANVILGQHLFAQGAYGNAIEVWKRIEQQQPNYLALVAEPLLDAYTRLGNKIEGLTLIRGYLESYPSLNLLDVAFQATLEEEGADAAYRLVRDELKRNPTLLGLDRLLEARLSTAPPEQRHDIEMVKSLVQSHTSRLARYRCENCGFKARQFYWRCPACSGWETYPPKRTEEFDLSP